MMTMIRKIASTRQIARTLFLGVTLLLAQTSHALLDIQITEGVSGGIPIAIVPFAWSGAGAAEQDVAAIIQADLARTGRFSLLPKADFLERPSQGDEINFDNWKALGVENLVVGKLKPVSPGNYVVQFQLFDIYKSGARGVPAGAEHTLKQIAGYNLPAKAEALRRTAHYISDIIYEKLTGERGAFTTRIAYVTATQQGSDKQYALQVADADGYNPFTVLRSAHPVMSPAWSPDGQRLAYVSFEKGRSSVYVQEMSTGKRELVSSRKGINGAPAWSPDGRQLALTLSDVGNVDVYVLDLAGRSLRRLTKTTAIETEPVWAPDGKSLVVTSDRSGSPQLYRIPVGGGRAQRLTFEGGYNSRAAFSPDGKLLAMVHNDGQGFRIAVQELATGNVQVLTDGRLDESPSFAPNGSMILYATEFNRKGVLAAVSVDGQVRQRLVLQEGDVREPAWAPYTQ